MQKKAISIIAGIVGVAIIIAVASIYNMPKPSDEIRSQWIVSGPFAVSKPQYKLGENVFMTVNNLGPNEVGNILIMTPEKKLWSSIPFNGTAKDHFNYYFKPDISRAAKINSTEGLVGLWIVAFNGTNYQPIGFEIINEYLPGFVPGEEDQIEILMNQTKIRELMNQSQTKLSDSSNSTG